MATHNLYIKSYDLYNEILEYQLPEGEFAILSREEFEGRGVALTFGDFSREGERVAGVFASPDGPVFFLDNRHLVGRFGNTFATSSEVPGRSFRYYGLAHKESPESLIEFALPYKNRLGIGTNPYDNEIEDVDLFALIASGVKHERFFRNYTREWCEVVDL